MMLMIINILFLLFSSDSFGSVFYADLVKHHAPYVIQEYGRHPEADVFTRFDFDGDFNADNNWKNLYEIEEIKPYVYYSVQETEQNWYINYGFFYPRDYAPVCFWEICHENDFEGVRITVKKTDSAMGEVILMETFAHGKVRYEAEPVFHPSRNQIMIFIERGGHAIRPFKNRKLPKHFKEYSSDDFEFLPLSDLWNLRARKGSGELWKDTFHYIGERFSIPGVPSAFEGRKWGHGLSNPPWAWIGGGKGARQGDWFFDPVISICRGYKCIDDSNAEYVSNSFLPLSKN
jgi:hypothetical protein